MSGRGKPSRERPWAWYEKSAVDLIASMTDAENKTTSTIAVYIALTKIASDRGTDTFDVKNAEVGSMVGLSGKWAGKAISALHRMKLIEVKENFYNGMQGPSTITLLPLGRNFLPVGIPRLRPPVPAKDKEKKESQKNDDDKRAAESSSSWNFVSSMEEAEKHPLWKEFCRWATTPRLKGFNTWLKSQPARRSKPKREAHDSPKRETREPTKEEFARIGQIARDEMKKLKAKFNGG